jgi:hypothetical protein
VPDPGEEPLQQHRRVAEHPLREATDPLQLHPQGALVVRDGHPHPAAAGRGLDHHRVADVVSRPDGLLDVPHRPRRATRHGHAGFSDQVAGPDLVTHRLDRLWRRADPDQPCLLHPPGEGGVLGQEAVPRVHRLGPGLPGRLQQSLDVPVALRRWRRSDRDRLVGLAHIGQLGVCLGVHGDRLQTHPLHGPDDPPGDLATVGDEHSLKHGGAASPS